MSDRKSRKEKLLEAARNRLKEEEAEAELPKADSGRQIMYRGQVVRSAGGATPGSGLSDPSSNRRAAAQRDARAALEKVKALYHDGLITREEAEAKRAEILDQI